MGHNGINWSPFTSNPLDYVTAHGEESTHGLVLPNGDPVIVGRSGNDFTVKIGVDNPVNTGSNLNTCYYLNVRQVGIIG